MFFDNCLPSRTAICLLSFSRLCLLLRENDIHRRPSVYSCTTGRMNWWPLYVLCITLCALLPTVLSSFKKKKKKKKRNTSLSLFVCRFFFATLLDQLSRQMFNTQTRYICQWIRNERRWIWLLINVIVRKDELYDYVLHCKWYFSKSCLLRMM